MFKKKKTAKRKESPYRESWYTQEIRDCLMGGAYRKRELWSV